MRHGTARTRRSTEHLQQWSDQWNGAYLARCTGLPADLASPDRDAPLRCLAHQRIEFVADVDALSSIQGASTSGDRILALVRGLPNPGECQRADDGVALLGPSEVEREVEQTTADVRAAHRLAHHADAHRGVTKLMRAVDQVRPSLRADLLLAAAEVLHADDASAALQATDDAVRAAVAAASPALIARALSARTAELANLGRLEPAVAASELALVTLGEFGLGGVEEVEVRRAHAVALGRIGRIDDALAVLAPLDGALEPGSLPWARYQRTLAPLLGQRGEVERALSSFEGARDAFATLHGPHADETVQVGIALVTFASEYRAPQRAAAAMPQACREPGMRASLERATAADCLVAQALVDLAAGATDDAYTGATEAVALHELVFGSDSPSTLGTLGLLASIASEQGKLGEAEAIHRNLADAFARTGDREAEALASGNLGATLEAMGRPREAVEAYERSLAATSTSRLRARALSGLASCRFELGEPAVARREFERALVECEQGGVPTPIELDVRWGLARVLVADSPARARDLAERARALAELLEDAATRDEIDAWLAAAVSARVEL